MQTPPSQMMPVEHVQLGMPSTLHTQFPLASQLEAWDFPSAHPLCVNAHPGPGEAEPPPNVEQVGGGAVHAVNGCDAPSPSPPPSALRAPPSPPLASASALASLVVDDVPVDDEHAAMTPIALTPTNPRTAP